LNKAISKTLSVLLLDARAEIYLATIFANDYPTTTVILLCRKV
jgi:hypothetical protein